MKTLDTGFSGLNLTDDAWSKEPNSAMNEPDLGFLDDEEEFKDPLFGLELDS